MRQEREKISDKKEIIAHLNAMASSEFLCGMSRFGINTSRALGVRVTDIRLLKKSIDKNNALALTLFETGIHEAQILASMVANPKDFSATDMDKWVADFDSWDVCDQCCTNLFRHLCFSFEKVNKYVQSPLEFTRRAGFALLATIAAGTKNANNQEFIKALPLIEKYAYDKRDSVKKAINWALRQIGKRNMTLYHPALAIANKLAISDNKQARWIGKDAVRELNLKTIIDRIKQ